MAKKTKDISLIEKLIIAKNLNRKKIRHHLFMIRSGADFTVDLNVDELLLLKKHISSQFQIGMSWDNFTFDWDISSTDILKVITAFEWDGKMDKFLGVCNPTAFTKQSI